MELDCLGIFLPILTLGALIGAIFGTFLAQSIGLDPIYIKNFVIVAMAGYFTAIGKGSFNCYYFSNRDGWINQSPNAVRTS